MTSSRIGERRRKTDGVIWHSSIHGNDFSDATCKSGLGSRFDGKAFANPFLSETTEDTVSETNFDDFMATREKAAEAYVRGDGAKVDMLVPHSGDASFHSPAGDTVVGGEAVAARYLQDAAAFHDNGSSRLEVLQKGHSDDVGYWTGFQIAQVQIGEMPKPVEMRIRVTEIFRKVDGDWMMIHRHADAPKTPIQSSPKTAKRRS